MTEKVPAAGERGMSDYPILFSGPMVKALLEGRKTQTRRMAKSWLKVKEGDRLWVRENLYFANGNAYYEADRHGVGNAIYERLPRFDKNGKPKKAIPCIHMPRYASRLTLIATADAREERLQDISEDDAIAESCAGLNWTRHPTLGITTDNGVLPSEEWRELWQSLHTKSGERWEDNPELAALTFRVENRNIDEGGQK